LLCGQTGHDRIFFEEFLFFGKRYRLQKDIILALKDNDAMKLFSILFIFHFSLVGCHSQKNDPKAKTELTPEIDFLRKGVHDSLKHLLPVLDSVFTDDQRYRKGNNPDTIEKYRELMRRTDSINLKKIAPIIEKYGILSFSDIGAIGYYAIVLTIQHSDLKTQEKYLPLFREAIKKKKVMPTTYAMLEDRIAIRNNKMQIYGTQVMLLKNRKAELLPVIDIDSVNQRRISIGMTETIELYLKQFGIKWDIEEYRKNLPRLKEKYELN
jgi:hypothetical protein